MYLCCICSKSVASSVIPYTADKAYKANPEETEGKTTEIAQNLFSEDIHLASPIRVRVKTEDGKCQVGFIDHFSKNKKFNIKTLNSPPPTILSRITNYLK